MAKMRRKNKKSAFFTIVIYVACLTFLIVVLCAGGYYYSMRGYLKRQIEDSNSVYLRQLASSYELFLKNTIDSSRVFIENDGRNVMSLYGESEDEYKRQMFRHLESISQMNGFMDSVYFYDRNTGMVYLSSGFSYEINDFYDGAWLDTVKEGKSAWQILSARIRKEPAGSERNVVPLVIRYPFSAVDSPYLYVIHLRADELFQYLIKNVYNEQTRSFKVADETGNVFISSESGSNFKNLYDFQYLEAGNALMNSEKSGSFLTEKEGKRFIVHFAVSDWNNWMYLSEMDYEAVLGQLKEPVFLIAVITGVLLTVGLFLCFLLSKRLYQPVKNLVNFVLPEAGMGELKEAGTDNEYELLRESYRNAFTKTQSLQETLSQNSRLIKKQFFYNLLAKNYYSEKEIDSQLEGLDLDKHVPYVITLYSVDEWHTYLGEFDRQEQSLWEYAFENIACEVASKYGSPVFVGIDANRFALLFTTGEMVPAEELERLAAAIAGEITAALYQFIHFTFSAGIGMAAENIYTVNRSYEQAREALAYLEEESGQVMACREIRKEKPKLSYPAETEEKLVEVIKGGDAQRAGEFMESVYREFKESNGGRRDGLPYFAFFMMSALMRLGNELQISQEEIFGGQELANIWENAVSRKNEQTVLKLLKNALERLNAAILAMRSEVSNSQVLRITEFIRENYKKPITLADIAEYAGVNQSTVSRLMKQNLKMSTVDYINQVRIEAAMELIAAGAGKVADLSEEAGFNNTHYFIRVFKKITGKTPGAMIEEMEKAGGKGTQSDKEML